MGSTKKEPTGGTTKDTTGNTRRRSITRYSTTTSSATGPVYTGYLVTLDFSAPTCCSRLAEYLGKPPIELNPALPTASSPSPSISSSSSLSCELCSAGECSLSRPHEELLLNLYWPFCHALRPVLDNDEFDGQYDALWSHQVRGRSPSALVDIMLALCMQLGGAFLPCSATDASVLFRRCHCRVASELEQPSLTLVQTYVLMALYQWNASLPLSASTMLATATRQAYMLQLHYPPPHELPPAIAALRGRIWWVLVVLEQMLGDQCGQPPALIHP